MNTLNLKGSVRLALVPAVCAGLLTACASYDRQEVHRTVSPAPASVTTVTTAPAASNVTVIGLFDQLDTNRDGFLSKAEVEPLTLSSYGLAFDRYDLNRDGFLSRSEAQPLMAMTRVSGGRWIVITTASFERMDVDRDGFLNRREAEPIMSGATFDRYDTNRDGFLSKSEAEPFFNSNVGATGNGSGGTVYGPR
jgi:hypothetical protein